MMGCHHFSQAFKPNRRRRFGAGQGAIMSLMAEGEDVQTPRVFGQSLDAILGALRSALLHMLAELPQPVQRAVEIERALGLDKRLAWQIHQLTQGDDARRVAHIPARSSMRRLAEAATTRGVSVTTVAEVEKAYAGYEEFVDRHAGDRQSLISLVSGMPTGKDEQHEEAVREALYRAQAHFWGLKLRLMVRTEVFLHPPAETGRTQDTVHVSGSIGLEQFRAEGKSICTFWTRGDTKDGKAPGVRPEVPFELLTQFCSRPLPDIRSRVLADGATETEIRIPAIGRTGAATIYGRHLNLNSDTGDRGTYRSAILICYPVETLVFDMLVPVGGSDPSSASVAVYGRRFHIDRLFERRVEDLVPQPVSVDYLGKTGVSIPSVPGAPRHSEAVEEVLTKMEYAHEVFDLYRCVVKYPVMQTMVAMTVSRVRAGTPE